MSLEGYTPDQIESMAAMQAQLLSDPGTRLDLQRLLKKSNPNLVIPELDTESRINEAIKPHVDELARVRAEREQEKAQNEANRLYETVRDGGAVRTRADFNDLVKYASENGFMTDEKGLGMAARYRESERQAAIPTPTGFAATAGLQMADLKDWMKDPAARARQEAHSIVDEFIKGRKAA